MRRVLWLVLVLVVVVAVLVLWGRAAFAIGTFVGVDPCRVSWSQMAATEDFDLLARIISAEARGESLEGQIAVANVVLNRVANGWYPDTIREVVYQQGQFCPVRSGTIDNPPTPQASYAAYLALRGVWVIDRDTVFFFNPDKTHPNHWMQTAPIDRTIGNHRFVRWR